MRSDRERAAARDPERREKPDALGLTMFHYKTSTAVVLFVSIFAFFALSGVTIRSSSAQSGDVSAPKFVAPRFTETERTDSEGSETKSTDFDLDDSSSPVLEEKE